MTKTMTLNFPIMMRRLSFVSTMAFPKKIVRLLHSAKQKELFLIGVPFSGGQVKYQTNSIRCVNTTKYARGCVMKWKKRFTRLPPKVREYRVYISPINRSVSSVFILK